VEYLLYGETLQAPDELQLIIEEGFPFSTNDHNPNMSTGAVVLSNSIALADMCRLQVLFSRKIVFPSRIAGIKDS